VVVGAPIIIAAAVSAIPLAAARGIIGLPVISTVCASMGLAITIAAAIAISAAINTARQQHEGTTSAIWISRFNHASVMVLTI
jgi:hypothetical protein